MNRWVQLVGIVVVIAGVELLLMIGPFPFRTGLDRALMDATLLAIISAPLIYLILAHSASAQQKSEATARESKAQFRAMLDAVAEGAVFVDGTGHITHVNRIAEEMFGFEVTPPGKCLAVRLRW